MVILKHNFLQKAAKIVQNGGILVYPTDTVWGLGGQATNHAVAQKIYAIKQKPATEHLIWLLPSIKAVEKYCGPVSPLEKRLLGQKQTTVIIHGQGVRVIRSGWLNKLLTACRCPLISTSANFHGQPPITTWRQAAATFGDQVDAIMRGRRLVKNNPSRIVQVQNGQIQVIRAGRSISIR